MADRNVRIAVILSAVDRMSNVIDRAINQSKTKLQKLSTGADAIADKAFKNGRNLAAMGIAAGGVLALPIKDAMKFQSLMSDVKKQMSDTSPDNLERMQKAIFQLSRDIPLPINQIQTMVAEGLKMGVLQTEIIDYTKQVAKMSVAFEAAPDEIATSMGKISNVFKIPIKEIGGISDAINFLDDKLTVTGPEIIDTLLKIGGSAKYLAANNAAALAATMTSMGETSDTAATAINAIFGRLGAATMQSGKFHEGIKQLGLTASDVQKRMSDRSTAQSAIIDVLTRINQLKPEKQNETLIRLFGMEHGPKLAKLTNNIHQYAENLKLLNGQEKGSVDREFQARQETAKANWDKMKNAMDRLSITAGTALLPSFTLLIEKVTPLIDKVGLFAEKNKDLISTVGKGIAAFAAFSLAGSGLSFLIGGVAKGVSIASNAFSIGTKVVQGLSTGLKVMIPVLNMLRVAFLTNPIGIAITAIAVGAFLIIKYWTPIKAFFLEMWGKIKVYFNDAWKVIEPIIKFTPLGIIINNWQSIKAFFKGLWSGIGSSTTSTWEKIKRIIDFSPLGIITTNWKKIEKFFLEIWDTVLAAFDFGVTACKFALKNFTPIGLLSDAWDKLAGQFGLNWDKVKKVFQGFMTWGIDYAKGFFRLGADIAAHIIDGLTSKLTMIKGLFKWITNGMKQQMSDNVHKMLPSPAATNIMQRTWVNENLFKNPSTFRPTTTPAVAPVHIGTARPIGTSNNSNATFNSTFNISLSGKATKEDAKIISSEMESNFKTLIRKHEQSKARVGFN